MYSPKHLRTNIGGGYIRFAIGRFLHYIDFLNLKPASHSATAVFTADFEKSEGASAEFGLAKEGAVIHGQRRLSLRMWIFGLILLIAPAGVTWIKSLSTPMPARVPSRMGSGPAVYLATRSPASQPDRRAESQQYWAALDAAMENGTLTTAQLDSAVEAFTVSLRQTSSDSLSFRKQFAERSMANAFARGIVSPETLNDHLLKQVGLRSN